MTRKPAAKKAPAVVGALVVVLVMHVAVTVVRAALTSPPRIRHGGHGRLLPSAEGAIDELAIQFHRPGPAAVLDAYEDMFRALDPRVTVRVIVSDEEDERLFDAARRAWGPRGPRVLYVRAGRPITSWIHDRLLVRSPATAGGALGLVAPLEPQMGSRERVNDWRVPWVLRDALGPRASITMASFRMDGGDFIADSTHAFVSDRIARRNEDRQPDEARLWRAIGSVAGRPVVRLGALRDPAPDHHVGMYVAPLGGGRVAVGDPELGLAALRRAGTIDSSSAPQVDVAGDALALDASPTTLARFRGVERRIRDAGLLPVRVPVVPSVEPYVWLSYTNAMFETRAGVLHVYMPAYGVEPLDRAATDAWREIGAVVHPIRVAHVFRMGGSVGCLTAVLTRRS